MLQVKNVEVVYMSVIQVLRGYPSTWRRQDRCLTRGNGAGKTTTLKAISGMLRTEEGEVSCGSIDFDGQRIDRHGPRRSQLWHKPSDGGRRVLEHLSVEENLLVGAYCRKDRPESRETWRWSLTTFHGSSPPPPRKRLPIRRRATDARHRSGAHGTA